MLKQLIQLAAALSGARQPLTSAGRRRRGKAALRNFERLEDRRVLSAATLLNEIDVNPPGRSDNRYMYVELEGTPGASLNNVWFVAIDSGGVPELALNLSGYSLGSDGFAVIKSSTGGFSIPAATTLIPDDSFFQQSGTAGFSQNPISFYLFSSPSAFSTSSDYDQNNDGVLDHLPSQATAMDHIAVSNTSETAADATYGGVVITEPTGGTPDAVTRFPGTVATNLASWFGGELVDTNNVASQETYDVTRPGTNMPDGAYLTPGSANYPVATTPPTLTAGGSPAQFTVSATPTPVAVDPNLTVTTGGDADLTGATLDITNVQSGDSLNFTSQNSITGTYSGGTLTLMGTASVADYQAALRSVTFSNPNTTTPSNTARVVTVTADDTAASPTTSNTVTDTVDVTIPSPTVTAGGSAALYTAGASAVTVDGGVTIGSVDTSHITGATVIISNFQSGDTLNFTSSSGITQSGPSTGGTLTLSGTATAAQYQTALQSVTFNSSSTSTTNRSVTVQVSDSYAATPTSSAASDTVDLYAPATVTALYVKGSSWISTYDNYLASHSLGNSSTPSLGFALQTGANQSKTLPWVNLNVIEATFSEAVNVTENSLVLSGSSASGYSTPSVTGFSSLGGNTYAWTLSTSLTANRLEISFLSTGANAVTDARGAGLSGNWTGGTSTFPSGDGLAGTAGGPNAPTSADFNFLFNALPGDALRIGTVNNSDYTDIKNRSLQGVSSTSYVAYYDLTGLGTINNTDANDAKARSLQALPSSTTAPGPQVSGVGGLQTSGDDADLGGEMLAVMEGATGQVGGGSTSTVSNQTSGGGTTSSSSGSSSSGSGSSADSSSTGSLASDTGGTGATDAAVSDFDVADLWA